MAEILTSYQTANRGEPFKVTQNYTTESSTSSTISNFTKLEVPPKSLLEVLCRSGGRFNYPWVLASRGVLGTEPL